MGVYFGRKFWFASVALLFLFLLNLYGLYGEGFSRRHYWIPESEHLAGGFFVYMWFSCFTHQTKFILSGLVLVTLIWEGSEYAVAVIPAFNRTVQESLKITGWHYPWWDTILDIALNYLGAVIFILLNKRGHLCLKT